MHHDIHKLHDKFHALADLEKYQHLLWFFEQLDGKNEYCSYIYQRLENSPNIFTSQLMESIYEESLQIYERTRQERIEYAQNSFAQCRDDIENLREKEANSMISDNEENLRSLSRL